MESLRLVSRELRVAPSRVYGVASFYHYFALKPRGEHNCLVCLGTACYVKGSERILEAVEKGFGVAPGGVTPDGRLGLQTARCLGSCGLAPAVVLDEELHPRAEPSAVVEAMRKKMNERKGRPAL
jgi:bidirectional [NiFe] hydrogenase diaphorase subunit